MEIQFFFAVIIGFIGGLVYNCTTKCCKCEEKEDCSHKCCKEKTCCECCSCSNCKV